MKSAMWIALSIVSLVFCLATGGAGSLGLMIIYMCIMSHKPSKDRDHG